MYKQPVIAASLPNVKMVNGRGRAIMEHRPHNQEVPRMYRVRKAGPCLTSQTAGAEEVTWQSLPCSQL